ncbi:MAG: type II secretion system protein [Magnetococcales bacterium]|nr:type II secretion system protein [Magnetococcales bacterium]
MKYYKTQNSSGYSLIELIFVIVILGVAAVGLLPMFGQALSSAQQISEMHQGQMLAQEAMSQIVADRWGDVGFTGVVAQEKQIDIGGPLLFEQIVEVQGGVYNSFNSSLSCSGSPYNNENYKCVIIKIKIASEEALLVRRWTILAR